MIRSLFVDTPRKEATWNDESFDIVGHEDTVATDFPVMELIYTDFERMNIYETYRHDTVPVDIFCHETMESDASSIEESIYSQDVPSLLSPVSRATKEVVRNEPTTPVRDNRTRKTTLVDHRGPKPYLQFRIQPEALPSLREMGSSSGS